MTPPSRPAPAAPPGLLREARLSRKAFDSNLTSLLAVRSEFDAVLDVRADAYGHGLSAVVAAATEHGIRRFRVSPGAALATGLDIVDGVADPESELSVYGFAETLDGEPLRPVLSLTAEVIAVKHIAAGSAISYGYTFRVQHDGMIALVGLGYTDGLPRRGSSVAHATIGGVSAVVAGRIAMDQFVLDLGGGNATVGDEVVVWGDPVHGASSLRDWATIAKRSPQQLTAGLGRRVLRVWVDEVSS